MVAKCVKCGKKSFADNSCEMCYLEEHPLLLKFKELDIVVCPVCARYFLSGKWHNSKNCNDAIHKAIEEHLYVDKTVKQIDIEGISPTRKLNPGVNVKGIADVTLIGLVSGKLVKDKYALPFDLLMKPCNNCRKSGSQYYEGILMIRNASAEDPIYEYVRSQILKFQHKGVFVTKEVPQRDGKDFYITSKSFLKMLGEKLVSEFGGELRTDARLFSRNTMTSKDIYRISVLLKLPEYRKGMVIKSEGKIILISAIGKKLTGTDLKSGKRISIETKNLHDIELLEKAKVQLVRTRPTVEVLHPETFQAIEVKNPELLPKIAKAGDEVEIAYDDGIVVLV